jgi:hypothetical protein
MYVRLFQHLDSVAEVGKSVGKPGTKSFRKEVPAVAFVPLGYRNTETTGPREYTPNPCQPP